MPRRTKTGPLSKAEKQWLEKWRGKKTVAELSRELNRSPSQIEQYAVSESEAERVEPEPPEVVAKQDLSILGRLRRSTMFAQLRKQFRADEVRLYEERYEALVRQMGEEVPESEALQIHKACVYELLINRNLVQQKEVEDELRQLESDRGQLMDDTGGQPGDADKLRLEAIDGRIGELTRRKKNLSEEHALNDGKQQGVLRDLKMTRDQRLSRIEDRREGFMEVIKKLMNADKREVEGRRAELMKQAADSWAAELTKVREFADGERDRVLLNVESLETQS